MDRSYRKKEWKSDKKITQKAGIIESLLQKKGLQEQGKINAFLHPSLSDISSPLEMVDIKEALKRIRTAFQKKERIIVFGDFDADGITSTVLLVSALQKLGGIVSYRIPDREKDSHGLKKYHIDSLKEKEVDLIITCDCGVNDKESIEYATEQGIDVIVTDHHTPKEDFFPKTALAVLNPKQIRCAYPFKELAGVGVAFTLISALAEELLEADDLPSFLQPYLELVALGTVADCVPLVDENRILVRYGLECMKETSWEGLQMLFERSNIDLSTITEDTIRFAIAPRLNAASRIGNVIHAVQLFLGDRAGHFERLTYLDQLNKERQELTHKALLQVENQDQDEDIVFVHDPDWRPGILGLVAGKLVEKYSRPVVALCDYEGLLHASCRSCPGISIIKGLQTCEDVLLYFGGHDGAAGFRMEKEKLPLLKQRLQVYFQVQKKQHIPLDITGDISASLIDLETIQILNQFRPFGEGNSIPLWKFSKVLIHDWKLMGAEQNHIRLFGIYDEKPIQIVGFFMGDVENMLQEGSFYDCVVELDESVWQGERRVDIRLVDIEKH